MSDAYFTKNVYPYGYANMYSEMWTLTPCTWLELNKSYVVLLTVRKDTIIGARGTDVLKAYN